MTDSHPDADLMPASAPALPSGTEVAFQPVPVRRRGDGWTPAVQHRFVEALAATGSVGRAAAQVGMSRQGAYLLRNRPGGEGFASAWDSALARAASMLSDTLFERALHGSEVPVFYQGEQVGTRIVHYEKLAIHMLCLLRSSPLALRHRHIRDASDRLPRLLRAVEAGVSLTHDDIDAEERQAEIDENESFYAELEAEEAEEAARLARERRGDAEENDPEDEDWEDDGDDDADDGDDDDHEDVDDAAVADDDAAAAADDDHRDDPEDHDTDAAAARDRDEAEPGQGDDHDGVPHGTPDRAALPNGASAPPHRAPAGALHRAPAGETLIRRRCAPAAPGHGGAAADDPVEALRTDIAALLASASAREAAIARRHARLPPALRADRAAAPWPAPAAAAVPGPTAAAIAVARPERVDTHPVQPGTGPARAAAAALHAAPLPPPRIRPV